MPLRDPMQEATDKIEFLKWLAGESFNPVGADHEEIVRISNRWIKERIRRASIQKDAAYFGKLTVSQKMRCV